MKLKELPPTPPIFNKQELIAKINTQLLKEFDNGVKLIDIKKSKKNLD